MKKLLALTFILLALAMPVRAEAIDIDGLSIEQLLALHSHLDAVIQEKLECNLDDNAIFQGVFVAGQDIVPGYYVLTCSEDSRGEGDFDFWYQVYESEDAYAAHNRSYFERFNFAESSFVQLDEGMVFEIVNGTAIIQAAAKPSWAP